MKELTIKKETLDVVRQMVADGQVSQEVAEKYFPEFRESESERIRKALKEYFINSFQNNGVAAICGVHIIDILTWLEKQGEQNPTQETESFEAEHGKYYYCIKDYFCGGKKQASKGDVIQALRGLPIMCLKDASEYFLPVNFIKCYRAWSEEDEKIFGRICALIHSAAYKNYDVDEDGNECGEYANIKEWFKKLKDRVQPQITWKPSDEQMRTLSDVVHKAKRKHDTSVGGYSAYMPLVRLYLDLKKLREE